MTFLLVMDIDASDTQWVAVAVADSEAAISGLPCYDDGDKQVFSKQEHPGQGVGSIQIANCGSPEHPEGGQIIALS